MRETPLCFMVPRGPYPRCPECGAELLPKVDPDRGMYWQCPKCGRKY